jgi:alpha-glucosidase (family GH31 glycosyl hydrolase)
VDWYNYWTNERFKGGQTIKVSAPIDTLPLFVRAGSIVPLGSAVQSTHDKQSIEKVRIYPGADASFTLFSDDGTTYAYEKGAGSIVRLHWDEAAGKFSHEGATAWASPDSAVVEVVGR